MALDAAAPLTDTLLIRVTGPDGPGITTDLLACRVGIISGGFTHFTDHLADRFKFDHAYANELEVRNGRLTGELVGDIVDAEAKARLLRQIAYIEGVPLEQIVAVSEVQRSPDRQSSACPDNFIAHR